jgi:hypothetical protein
MKIFKFLGITVLVAVVGFLSVSCRDFSNNINQTPVASDYTVDNLNQIAGSVTAVTITPKVGKSTGAITVFYNGSTALPTAVGTYVVRFDVAAATGWNEATELLAGTLTINPNNQTPVAADFDIGNLTQTAGSVTAVTITPKVGKSTGAISNIRYNGSTTIPQTVGTYSVTFDVVAATGWNAASGLSAGNLVVGNPANQTPVASDYTVGNLNQTAGSVTAVTVTANSGKSPGEVTNIRYNGSTTIPQAAGTYSVTFDVAAATGWNAVTALIGGELIIDNTGILIGSSTVRLFLNNSTTPLQEQGSTIFNAETGTYTVSIFPGVYSEIIWYLNGNVASVGTSNTSLILTRRIPGTFFITVEVTAAGEKNTGSHYFVIE